MDIIGKAQTRHAFALASQQFLIFLKRTLGRTILRFVYCFPIPFFLHSDIHIKASCFGAA